MLQPILQNRNQFPVAARSFWADVDYHGERTSGLGFGIGGRTIGVNKISSGTGRKALSTMKAQNSISRTHCLNTKARYLIAACTAGLLLLEVPLLAQAQFNYTTNNGSITITGYSGPGGAVTVPPVISGLPVTSIGTNAFYGDQVASVTIPDSVTSIGDYAFAENYFTSLTIPDGVITIGSRAFFDNEALESLIIGINVTTIGNESFEACYNLATVTIGNSVTNIGGGAFASTYLGVVYFHGDAPSFGASLFEDDAPVVYYLPGMLGQGSTFAGFPTVLWNPHILTSDAGFGVRSNQFGFDIAFTNTVPVVVEATTNLVNPVWVPLQTVTLTNGLFHFTEPFQTTNATRFYRLSPF